MLASSLRQALKVQGPRSACLLASANNRNMPSRQNKRFSSSAMASAEPESVPVTLIQGDGVYPEILESVESVLRSAGVPIDFEPFFLSDIHAASSAQLADVVASVRRNGVCLRGIMGVPEFSRTGALDSVDMKFR